MGWVLMSERDVRRHRGFDRSAFWPADDSFGCGCVGDHGPAGQPAADSVSGHFGGGGLIHKGRGKSSNHSASAGVREYVLELVRTKYADFGPTLATEVLLAKHDVQVGETLLRTWMLRKVSGSRASNAAASTSLVCGARVTVADPDRR